MKGTWAFVAKGNDRAFGKAINGDIDEALIDIDKVRDEALKMEDDPSLQNEIECRRLETRMHVAGVSRDLALFAQFLSEMGKSNRFSAERLHSNIEVAAAFLRDIAKGHKR